MSIYVRDFNRRVHKILAGSGLLVAADSRREVVTWSYGPLGDAVAVAKMHNYDLLRGLACPVDLLLTLLLYLLGLCRLDYLACCTFNPQPSIPVVNAHTSVQFWILLMLSLRFVIDNIRSQP